MTIDEMRDKANQLLADHDFLYKVGETDGWQWDSSEPDKTVCNVYLEDPNEDNTVQVRFSVDFSTDPPTVDVY